MLKRIHINNFRIFNDKEIILGKLLTVLAGGNATGKSTVLGMLGNSCELKQNIAKTYLNKSFRAEFSEIFKGSMLHDASGSNKYEIFMSNEDGTEIDSKKFRVAWQTLKKKSYKRFRLIPNGIVNGKKSNEKFKLPVYYLGLSRLYPVGEANIEGIKTKSVVFKTEDDKNWYIENYKKILSIKDEISDVSGSTLSETSKKTCIGINTKNYDYLTNSAGQDNIGQILLAMLSFKKAKEKMGDIWQGGLFLIDEFDAALHPSAQNKLIDILISFSKNTNVQVVFTTHSLSLLEYISTKTAYNNNDVNNNIELNYFSTANLHLDIDRNIDFQCVKNDLLVQASIVKPKIKIYSEDAEARWFLKHLLPTSILERIQLIDHTIGCEELIHLMNADSDYFANNLIVFDGDVDNNKKNKIKLKQLGNFINLPGQNQNPEEVFYDYLRSLTHDHPYWSTTIARTLGFTITYFEEHNPSQENEYSGEKRIRYKKWFNDHLEGFESTDLYEYWKNDNKDIVKDFINDFILVFNKIAERTCLPEIIYNQKLE